VELLHQLPASAFAVDFIFFADKDFAEVLTALLS